MDRYQHLLSYKSLENDFVGISNYIQVSEKNYNTYSVALGKLISNSCMEIERQIRKIVSMDGFSKIKDWHDPMTTRHDGFKRFEIICVTWPSTYAPWEEWSKESPPSWWTAYNNIKHDKRGGLKNATLLNGLLSLTALLVSSLFYEKTFHCSKDKEGNRRIILPLSLLPYAFKTSRTFGAMLHDQTVYALDI